jgi:RNA polymerase sigma-70 factor (ECF subfamily)
MDALEQDQLLVDRIVQGDPDALRLLYERHASRAMAVALRVLRVRADAEEVLQESFLQIWRTARRYSPERASPERWVVMVVRARALDRLRASTTRARAHSAASHEAPGEAGPPSAGHEEGERARQVRDALSELPPEQRAALELAYYEGLSQSEISEQTGIPFGTVKTRMRLGMLKLASRLPDA